MPTLSFYTPTHKRPARLERCKASVYAQGSNDWQHVIVPDHEGVGVGGMYAAIPQHTGAVTGDYVYILQDDDALSGPNVVQDFVNYLERFDEPPPVIICRNLKGGAVLPTRWQEEPACGYIDLGNVITRADVWRANVDKYGHRYEGDYDYVRALWDAGIPFTWWDYEFAWGDVGRGQTE